jgi:hypothetical protein
MIWGAGELCKQYPVPPYFLYAFDQNQGLKFNEYEIYSRNGKNRAVSSFGELQES